MRDVRICAIGDSFVAGVGDAEHRGWVGRLAASTHEAGLPVTLYNLGVRRDTSRDVLARAGRELGPRLPDAVDGRVVVSFGVNDTTAEERSVRVGGAESAGNLATLLGELGGRPVLVVGPPPVADVAQTGRIAELSDRYAEVCATAGVPWCPVVERLRDDPVWIREVAAGDGSHPGAAGYDRMARLVAPAWDGWLAGPAPATRALRDALDGLLAVADQLGAGDLDGRTGCAGWDVRRLLEHLVGWQRVFAACLADREPPFADGSPTYRASADPMADPVADLRAAASSLVATVQRRADPTVTVPYRGRTTVADLVDELVAETVLHAWDLAVARSGGITPSADVLVVAHRGLTRLLEASFAPVAFRATPSAAGDGLAALLDRSGRSSTRG